MSRPNEVVITEDEKINMIQAIANELERLPKSVVGQKREVFSDIYDKIVAKNHKYFIPFSGWLPKG